MQLSHDVGRLGKMSAQPAANSNRSRTWIIAIVGVLVVLVCLCVVGSLGLGGLFFISSRSSRTNNSTAIPVVEVTSPSIPEVPTFVEPTAVDTPEAPTAAPEASATPTPQAELRPGYWAGHAGSDPALPILFKVDDDGTIENFAIYITIDSDCGTHVGDGHPSPNKVSLTDSKFKDEWDAADTQHKYKNEVRGQVVDLQSVKGEINVNINPAGPGLGDGCATSYSATFKAEWESDSPVQVPTDSDITPTS